MAESTLSLALTDLEQTVGDFLGYGRGTAGGDSAWTARQQADITEAVKSGQRQVYFTVAVPELGIPAGYDWSFLRPTATLTLESGAATLLLPDDFGGLTGEITLSADGSSWRQLRPYPVGTVYGRQQSLPDTTGCPTVCCVEPVKGTSALKSSRQQLRFWPTADQAYTLKVSYSVLPDALDGTRAYAYGGAQHAELLRAACRKAAEETFDDSRAVWAAIFREQLAAAVAQDRRQKPQRFGYNGDRHPWEDGTPSGGRAGFPGVTINGVLY